MSRAKQVIGAATTDYVDSSVAVAVATLQASIASISGGSLDPKSSVLTLGTANQATRTGLAQTIGGYALSHDGDTVLLIAQTDAKQNGPWTVHSGSWTRPTDFAAASNASGAYMLVILGDYAGRGYFCKAAPGSDVVGTDNLPFDIFNFAGTYINGTGLALTGTTFSVNYGTSSTTAAAGNDSRITGALQSITFAMVATTLAAANAGIAVNSQQITGLAAGSSGSHAVNKTQMDAGDGANATAAATAQTTANTAVTNAATAQTTANTAVTNAATAQTAANTAQSTANSAASTASTASSTATSAASTASSASSTASAASAAAATATTTANAALPKAGGTMTGDIAMGGKALTAIGGTTFTPSEPAFSTTPALNFGTSSVFTLPVATGNVAATITNAAKGKSVSILFTQDTGGGRSFTVTPPGGFTFVYANGASSLAPTQAGNAATLYTAVIHGTLIIWSKVTVA